MGVRRMFSCVLYAYVLAVLGRFGCVYKMRACMNTQISVCTSDNGNTHVWRNVRLSASPSNVCCDPACRAPKRPVALRAEGCGNVCCTCILLVVMRAPPPHPASQCCFALAHACLPRPASPALHAYRPASPPPRRNPPPLLPSARLQVIDDVKGHTLAAASSVLKDLKEAVNGSGANIVSASGTGNMGNMAVAVMAAARVQRASTRQLTARGQQPREYCISTPRGSTCACGTGVGEGIPSRLGGCCNDRQ